MVVLFLSGWSHPQFLTTILWVEKGHFHKSYVLEFDHHSRECTVQYAHV